ncbi:MAG: hypothetical protein Kow0099_23220 [Candidatus Abyssubacteria bacterium]
MRVIIAGAVLLLALCVVPGPARADQIILSNGDVITGQVMEIAGGWLRIETEYAGELVVDFSRVANLVTETEARIHFINGDVISARVERLFEDRIALVSGHLGEMEVRRELFVRLERDGAEEERIERDYLARRLEQAEAELEQAKKEVAEKEKELQAVTSISKLWSGSFALGAQLERGNSESTDLHIELTAVREMPREELRLRVFADYGESEGETDSNNIFGEAKLKVFQTEQRYVFGVTNMEYDEMEKLDLRAQVFSGLGYNFIKTDRTLLLGEIGAGLTGEFFDENGDDETLEAAIWLNGEWKQKVFTRSELLQILTLFPSVSDFGEYRLRSETSLVTPLNDAWSIKLSLIDDYDSDPEGEDVEHNDLKAISSVNYTF